MLAPSYQKNYTQIGEEFTENGKVYVMIKHNKTGNERKARSYNAAEWNKLYGDKTKAKVETPKVEVKPSSSWLKGAQKKALGFENGFITIFKGDTYPYKEWFKQNAARYHKLWGWYFISTDELPADTPSTLTPIRLEWEHVGTGEFLNPDSEVSAYVDEVLYESDGSEQVCEIGYRDTYLLTVERVIRNEGYWGMNSFYIMKDEFGNHFTWSTGNSDLEEGMLYEVTGTLKEIKKYRGQIQNVLTRCKCAEVA